MIVWTKKESNTYIVHIIYSQFPPNNQIAGLSQSYTQAKNKLYNLHILSLFIL
jgi:hypothetical protein